MEDWVFTEPHRNNYTPYGRTKHAEQTILQDKLKKIYKTEYARVTTSGINSISAIFHNYIRNKDHINIVYSHEIYPGTMVALHYIKFGFLTGSGSEKGRTNNIDVSDTKSIIELFEKQYKNKEVLLFIESCTNPSGKIFDFNIIPTLKNITNNKLMVVVDNSWLSGCSFNPFIYDVDVVVESLTKYCSGGKTICGAIMTNNKNIIDETESFMCAYGLHVSPGSCERISFMIDTVEDRIKISSYNTLEIIKFLKNKDNIHIYHPSMETHTEHKFAKDNFKYYPSVFFFKLKKPVNEVMSWLVNNTNNIKQKTSYGSPENKMDEDLHDDEHGYTHCRFAVSYKLDSYKDAIKDLQKLLEM